MGLLSFHLRFPLFSLLAETYSNKIFKCTFFKCASRCKMWKLCVSFSGCTNPSTLASLGWYGARAALFSPAVLRPQSAPGVVPHGTCTYTLRTGNCLPLSHYLSCSHSLFLAIKTVAALRCIWSDNADKKRSNNSVRYVDKHEKSAACPISSN